MPTCGFPVFLLSKCPLTPPNLTHYVTLQLFQDRPKLHREFVRSLLLYFSTFTIYSFNFPEYVILNLWGLLCWFVLCLLWFPHLISLFSLTTLNFPRSRWGLYRERHRYTVFAVQNFAKFSYIQNNGTTGVFNTHAGAYKLFSTSHNVSLITFITRAICRVLCS